MLLQREASSGQEPERVAIPHAPVRRRVGIGRGVGGGVMLAVMPRPPQRSPLTGGAAQHGHDELHCTADPKRPVAEIAMIEGSDEEHPQQIRDRGGSHRGGADAGEEHTQTGQVKGDKRRRPHPVHTQAVGLAGDGHGPGVIDEPAPDSQPGGFIDACRCRSRCHAILSASVARPAGAVPLDQRTESLKGREAPVHEA